MKRIKTLLGLTLMLALAFTVQAGKTSGGTTTGGFTFQYNVGALPNYHAYGVACQVGTVSPQPKGTIVLGNYWVWDLGPVSGVGAVTCPKPITPKGQTVTLQGMLLFANTSDIGGQPVTHPVADVQIFTQKLYNGYASISVIAPDGSSAQLYWGLPFTPFAWDLSPYLW